MKNLTFFVVCFMCGVIGAFLAEPFVHENGDVILIIVTVFTVFAGFLVAIITVLGDPGAMPKGWKAKQLRREPAEFRIIRHNALFFLYLITIAVLFVGAIINKIPDAKISDIWKIWIDRAYLFLAITSFLLTFGLPSSLKRMQMDRLDAVIDQERAAIGVDSQSD